MPDNNNCQNKYGQHNFKILNI